LGWRSFHPSRAEKFREKNEEAGMKKLIGLAVMFVLAAGIVFAQATQMPTTKWPTKPVQVIVPAGAGGDTDFNARTMAKYFEKLTGKPMVITNMGGGGGSIATSTVKNATPDGSVMLFGHIGQVIVNEVAGLIDYNFNAFDIVCIPAIDKGTVLVTGKKSGFKSVQDVIAKAKANPDKVIFGTELGGLTHLQGLIFQKIAGIQMKIVDVGSASDKITSLLGGRIDLAAITYGAVQDYQKTGDLVILAQFNTKRNQLLGDIPTFAEQGVNFAMEKPYVMAFPKGTDPAIVQKMAMLMKQITEMPEYAKDLEKAYKQPVDYLDTNDAIKLLGDIRTNLMQYRDMIQRKK
jgi:tripartite-type tricarboxylate transporter receptor subunit TctC